MTLDEFEAIKLGDTIWLHYPYNMRDPAKQLIIRVYSTEDDKAWGIIGDNKLALTTFTPGFEEKLLMLSKEK